MATRNVLVKVVRPDGKITLTEMNTINDKKRIVIHMGMMDCIIDEGPEGQPFNKIYRNVKRVQFTRKKESGMQVVLVHRDYVYPNKQHD